MKTCKMAMAACGAVLAGVVYGCIAASARAAMRSFAPG